MSIVNPTIIKSSGDVSEALGIFSVGARGTATNMDKHGRTETVPPTNTN